MKVKRWDEASAPWPDAIDSTRCLTARNTVQPQDLFIPSSGMTVTREQYYQCVTIVAGEQSAHET